MQAVIAVLSGFVTCQMIFGLFYAQMGLSAGAFRLFFTEAATVPMILLSFGPWIQAAALGLVLAFLAHRPAEQVLFPRFVGGGAKADNMEAPGLALIWEWISVGIILILPLIGFAYWWTEFLDPGRGAWIKASLAPKGVFERVDGCFLINTLGHCRYGSLPPVAGSGDDFAPFWQPVFVMGGGTLVVVGLTAWILLRIVQRAPIRITEVRRQGIG